MAGEADIERVLVGADFRDALIIARQSYAQHLRNPPRHHLLIDPLVGNQCGVLAAFAQQSQLNRDSLAYRLERRQPLIEIMPPLLAVLLQPEMVGRQIEFTHAARYARALLDTHQPIVLAQLLTDFAGSLEQA